MPERRYAIYDVFTDRPFAGNPLALVLDCDGLDTAAMQAIAREFNFSETAFVLPAADSRHRARIRIFTPAYEMPFAGHPTIGAAIALTKLAGSAASAEVFVLEEKIGPVRCAVRRKGGQAHAEFDMPVLPQRLSLSVEPEPVGAALSIPPHRIGFENHRVSLWTAGVPYLLVPVADLAAAAEARIDNAAWLQLAPARPDGSSASAYVYCRETLNHDCDFHARMFVAGIRSYEDPATGSAAAAFAGAVDAFDRPPDGLTRIAIEQGVEMGRPSRIMLEIDRRGGAMAAGRIGGEARKVAEGKLLV